MEKRIVGYHDDHPGLDSHISESHEGIGRHIQAHVLHGAQAAHTGYRRRTGRFHGDFFVYRIFYVNLGLGGELIKTVDNFRRRRPRIGRDKADTTFDGAANDCFIAQ